MHWLTHNYKFHDCILHYFTGATAFSRSYFGGGTGGILLDNVGCSGQEQYLVNCSHSPIGVHDCSHFEDAGVFCVPPRELISELYTGSTTS